MESTKLQQILKLHEAWLIGSPEGVKANLVGANLSKINLTGADLSGADLSEINLTGADLSGADLTRANLAGANLFKADLSGADLSDADLSGADLIEANLFGTTFMNTNIISTVFSEPVYSFLLGKHLAIATTRELFIGCERFSWDYWLANYKEIGKEAGYSKLEIKQYGFLIKTIYKMIQEKINNAAT